MLGTCAGMICLAKKVFNSQESVLEPLEVMDIKVKRNAFGRQVDSFETDLQMPVWGKTLPCGIYPGSSDRESGTAGESSMPRLPDGTIVAAQQGNLLVSFFPSRIDG